MSGPTTVIISADPFISLLSGAAILAALAIAKAHKDAGVLVEQQQTQRDALQTTQEQAATQGQMQLQDRLKTAENNFEHLTQLAEKIGYASQVTATRPSAPQTNDEQEITLYVRTLEALAEQLRPVLMAQAARQADALNDGPDVNLDSASAAVVPQALVARLMARIAHIAEIPAQIQTLAQELERSLPGGRATLLAMELRIQVQALLAAELEREVQQAQAIILEQCLKDLGYQVEEIGNTLFVDGGVVHFRRAGWDNYMVRMRVDPKTKTANFNVIRAVAEGENERSVLDHLAEDRWCSEFPALLAALDVRGMKMQVTRRLEAGELPVQLVNASTLPQFSEVAQEALQETQRSQHRPQPLAKKLP